MSKIMLQVCKAEVSLLGILFICCCLVCNDGGFTYIVCHFLSASGVVSNEHLLEQG